MSTSRLLHRSYALPNSALARIGCFILIPLVAVTTGRADPARPADSAPTLTVRSQQFQPQFFAYARVEPVALLPVHAPAAGQVAGLQVVPGSSVTAGQVVAELTGPEVRAQRTQARADVESARVHEQAAAKELDIDREKLTTHESTRQAVAAAESALAAARAQLATATARLQSMEQVTQIRAPEGGSVVAVVAANGQRVAEGGILLTIQPTRGLWAKAAFYGADAFAIAPGMTGTFSPESGAPIPVRLETVFPALSADGGRSVGLVTTGANPDWLNGEAGTVTLDGAPRMLPVVPTDALVLDRGTWWVVVHAPQGDHPQEVVPGPSRGWQTFIEHGLAPGAEVVVQNAYLEYHRDIARQYQPPD